jgi:hypothetical protein
MWDTRPRHWNWRKVNHDLPQYLFNQRSGPTAVKCIYQIRCSKFTRFPCIPTREDVWRHFRVIINRVVPQEADRPIHNNQQSDRPSRSHDWARDEPTIRATPETERVTIPIILIFYLAPKVFVRSVPCFLPAPLLGSNLGMRFLLRGEGCNALCYNFPNYLHWHFNHASIPMVNPFLSKIERNSNLFPI